MFFTVHHFAAFCKQMWNCMRIYEFPPLKRRKRNFKLQVSDRFDGLKLLLPSVLVLNMTTLHKKYEREFHISSKKNNRFLRILDVDL